MKKLMKWVLITLLVLAILGGLLMLAATYFASLPLDDPQDSAEFSGQKTTISTAGISIATVPIEKKSITLKSVELCSYGGNALRAPSYSYSSNCINGVCTTEIDVTGTKAMPIGIVLNVREGEGCVPKTLRNLSKYVKSNGYTATIGLTHAQRREAGIADGQEKFAESTPNSHFTAIQLMGAGASVVYKLDYTDDFPKDDELTIGGKRVQVNYQMNTPEGAGSVPVTAVTSDNDPIIPLQGGGAEITVPLEPVDEANYTAQISIAPADWGLIGFTDGSKLQQVSRTEKSEFISSEIEQAQNGTMQYRFHYDHLPEPVDEVVIGGKPIMLRYVEASPEK